MRKIDADELEELFREVIGSLSKRPELDGKLEHMIRASAMVIEMINDMPTIEDTDEKIAWKTMAEEPKKEDWYLVTIKDNNNMLTHVVETDYWNDYGDWDIYTDSVLAWTELPEPYKE